MVPSKPASTYLAGSSAYFVQARREKLSVETADYCCTAAVFLQEGFAAASFALEPPSSCRWAVLGWCSSTRTLDKQVPPMETRWRTERILQYGILTTTTSDVSRAHVRSRWYTFVRQGDERGLQRTPATTSPTYPCCLSWFRYLTKYVAGPLTSGEKVSAILPAKLPLLHLSISTSTSPLQHRFRSPLLDELRPQPVTVKSTNKQDHHHGF